MTPHSLVASLEEARKMGGTHHPLLGVFGVMSAKMTVANLMILVTFMSFIMYWRAGKQETATWAKVARAFMGGVLGLAAIVVIVLGVWGYFVPAIIRINYFSTSQVLIVLFVMLTITPLTALAFEERQNDHGNGLGPDATARRVCAGAERGHGHSLDDPDGLCPVFVARALACLRRHAGLVAICVFPCVGVCRGVHGAQYVPVLHARGLYFLGRDHGG